jgi:hypothetical protein
MAALQAAVSKAPPVHSLSLPRSFGATSLACLAMLVFAGSASATVTEPDPVPVAPVALPGDEIHSSSVTGSGRPEVDASLVRHARPGKARRVGRLRRAKTAAAASALPV